MIEQLISRIFCIRNDAHLAHWKSKSYAQHEALGDFYEAIIGTLDKLVEAYQGYFGIVGEIPNYKSKQTDIVKMLSVEAVWITTNRSEIAKNLPALENIVDELSGEFYSTIYKLVNLK